MLTERYSRAFVKILNTKQRFTAELSTIIIFISYNIIITVILCYNIINIKNYYIASTSFKRKIK